MLSHRDQRQHVLEATREGTIMTGLPHPIQTVVTPSNLHTTAPPHTQTTTDGTQQSEGREPSAKVAEQRPSVEVVDRGTGRQVRIHLPHQDGAVAMETIQQIMSQISSTEGTESQGYSDTIAAVLKGLESYQGDSTTTQDTDPEGKKTGDVNDEESKASSNQQLTGSSATLDVGLNMYIIDQINKVLSEAFQGLGEEGQATNQNTDPDNSGLHPDPEDEEEGECPAHYLTSDSNLQSYISLEYLETENSDIPDSRSSQINPTQSRIPDEQDLSGYTAFPSTTETLEESVQNLVDSKVLSSADSALKAPKITVSVTKADQSEPKTDDDHYGNQDSTDQSSSASEDREEL